MSFIGPSMANITHIGDVREFAKSNTIGAMGDYKKTEDFPTAEQFLGVMLFMSIFNYLDN